MNQISLDMYQTLGMAVAVLFLGAFLKKRIKFLETFCIPSPVVGGLIFAIVSCILYATGILEISFDETLKNVCMVIFFTSVGFQANLKVLKSGGLSLICTPKVRHFWRCIFLWQRKGKNIENTRQNSNYLL